MYVDIKRKDSGKARELIDQKIGQFMRLTGRMPNVIELDADEFERLQFDLVTPRARDGKYYYSGATQIEVQIH